MLLFSQEHPRVEAQYSVHKVLGGTRPEEREELPALCTFPPSSSSTLDNLCALCRIHNLEIMLDCLWKICFHNFFLVLHTTCVWSGSEISKFCTYSSTHKFTVQQLLEGIVLIWMCMNINYPHFMGGSQKCTQGTPLVKVRNGKKLKMLNLKFAWISDPAANSRQTAVLSVLLFVRLFI